MNTDAKVDIVNDGKLQLVFIVIGQVRLKAKYYDFFRNVNFMAFFMQLSANKNSLKV